MIRTLPHRIFLRLKDRQSTLLGSFVIYAVSLGGAGLLNVLLLAFLAHALSKEEFGKLGLLLVCIPLLGRLVTLGTDIGLSIKVWKVDAVIQREYLWTSVAVSTFMAFFLSLLFITLGPWIEEAIGWEGSVFIVVAMCVGVWLRGIGDLLVIMLRREGKVIKTAGIMFARASVLVLVCMVIVLLGTSNASSYLVALVAAELVIAMIAIYHFMIRYGDGSRMVSVVRFRELAKIGFPSIPGSAAGILLAAGDRFVIGVRLNLEAVAIYTLGYRFAEYTVHLFFIPFASAFGPIAIKKATRSKKDYNRYIANAAGKGASVAPLIIGCIAIFGPQLISGAGGGEYAYTYPIFLLAMFGIVIYNVSQLASVSFAYHERLNIYVWIILIAAILNIILNWIFIPIFGVIAAAIVTIVAYEGIMCASVVLVNYVSGSKISLVSLHAPLIYFGIFLLVVYGIDQWSSTETIKWFWKAVAWVAYFGISWVTFRAVRESFLAAYDFTRRQVASYASVGM